MSQCFSVAGASPALGCHDSRLRMSTLMGLWGTIINSAVNKEHLITPELSTAAEHLQPRLSLTPHQQENGPSKEITTWITTETSCFHHPAEQRGAGYRHKHEHRLSFLVFCVPAMVSEGGKRNPVTDANRSGSWGLDAAGHPVVNGWELRGGAAWRRENKLWPNRRKRKQWRCCLTSNWQAVTELSWRLGMDSAALH